MEGGCIPQNPLVAMSLFKVCELALLKNTRYPLRLVILKNYLFILFNVTAESLNCSLLKNLEKNFCNSIYEKNFVKHIEILSQHLLEKFIRDNLSINVIALRNLDLSIIGNAQDFFKVIDYRYRFSIERFIVPITVLINALYFPVHLMSNCIFFRCFREDRPIKKKTDVN